MANEQPTVARAAADTAADAAEKLCGEGLSGICVFVIDKGGQGGIELRMTDDEITDADLMIACFEAGMKSAGIPVQVLPTSGN